MYLIAATLPSLRPLLRRIFRDGAFGGFFTRLQSYYVHVFSTKRETDNVPLAGVYSGPSITSSPAKPRASGSTRSVSFKQLDDLGNRQHLSSGGEEKGVKTPHTYREHSEHGEDEEKTW